MSCAIHIVQANQTSPGSDSTPIVGYSMVELVSEQVSTGQSLHMYNLRKAMLNSQCTKDVTYGMCIAKPSSTRGPLSGYGVPIIRLAPLNTYINLMIHKFTLGD